MNTRNYYYSMYGIAVNKKTGILMYIFICIMLYFVFLLLSSFYNKYSVRIPHKTIRDLFNLSFLPFRLLYRDKRHVLIFMFICDA